MIKLRNNEILERTKKIGKFGDTFFQKLLYKSQKNDKKYENFSHGKKDQAIQF